MNVQEYLTIKGYDYTVMKRPSGPTAVMRCPKCNDKEKTFGISLDNGAFSCMRKNHCDWRGSFADFQRFHGDAPRRIVGDADFKQKPKEYDLPKHDPDEADQEVFKFFSSRGISENVVKQARIGRLRTAISFRYYEGGELVNIKYRGLAEKKFHQEKNARPVLYGRDNVPDEAQELIICEGEIDYLSFLEYGILGVVSIPSGATDVRWIEYNWDWLKRFKKIYLSYDMDEAGRSMIPKVAKRLGDYRVYDLQLPYKDANECLLNGVKDIGGLLLSAEGYDRDELKCATDYEDQIVDQIMRPSEHYGRTTGIRFLDNTLKGWRDSELTVWTGRSASGKTTKLMQVVIADILTEAEKGRALPVCIGSFEMRPEVLLAWAVKQARYIMKSRKGKAWSSEITEGEIRSIITSVLQNVYIVNIKDRVSEDLVFDLFEFAARKYGCRVFVIDSLMRIHLERNVDKFDAQLSFMDRAAKFSDTFSVHLHLVAHPRKSESDTDRPDKVAVKGASEITDIADNVISLYRHTEAQRQSIADKKEVEIRTIPDTVLSLMKNRAEGICGECKMMFDFENKTFVEQW